MDFGVWWYDNINSTIIKKPETKTNFDKIREMSVEDFAEWYLTHDFCLCPDEACKNGVDCEKCLTKWLNSPANPEHLNGKFVCTSADPEESFTPGKVYTFTDGRTIDDYGKTRPDEQYAPIDNIDDYNRATANFISYVEE